MNTQETTTTKPTKRPRAKKAGKATGKATKANTTKRNAKTSRTTKGQAAARAGSKKAIVLELLRREQGATHRRNRQSHRLAESQHQSFVSGHVTKKMGIKVESTKNNTGERRYRILT